MPKKSKLMYPHLDIFQVKKHERMRFLLEDLEEKKKIPLKEFLSHVAVMYGIARATTLEYIRDWVDGGYITVQKNIIEFVQKPKEWEEQ